MSPAVRTTSTWGQPVTVQSTRTNRWNPDVSTKDTIAILRRLAHQYAGDPSVQFANMQALSALGPNATQRDKACAIFYWVRGSVRFVEDETLLYQELGIVPEELDKELLIIPPVLLRMPVPMGDCDDFSLLIASMALAAGIQPHFVTVAADPTDPRRFSHIYVCLWLDDEGEVWVWLDDEGGVWLDDEGGKHFCLDAGNRLPAVPPGWEPSQVARKAIWSI